MTPDRLLQYNARQAAGPQGAFRRSAHLGHEGWTHPQLHQFARDGVTLLGLLRGVAGHRLLLAPDLYQNLARANGFELQVRQRVDGYIRANGLDAPPEELPLLRDGYEQPMIEELDLQAAGITTVIWATGYTFDFSLVKLPVRDADGFPIQARGVTYYPGLYFVGMRWMPSPKSGILTRVGESARHIASKIVKAGAHA